MDRIKVQDLWNEVCIKVGDENAKYSVVGVLNAGDGPDEHLLNVEKITWDHDLGVLRLELEAK